MAAHVRTAGSSARPEGLGRNDGHTNDEQEMLAVGPPAIPLSLSFRPPGVSPEWRNLLLSGIAAQVRTAGSSARPEGLGRNDGPEVTDIEMLAVGPPVVPLSLSFRPEGVSPEWRNLLLSGIAAQVRTAGSSARPEGLGRNDGQEMLAVGPAAMLGQQEPPCGLWEALSGR